MNKMGSIKFLLRVVLVAAVLTIVSAKGASAGSEESFSNILESLYGKVDVKREVIEKNYASQFSKKDIPFLKEKALKDGGNILAIELLGQIGGESAADALEEIALKVRYQFAFRAILAIEDTKTPDLKRRLENLATTKHPERIMRTSAMALRWLGDSVTAAKLNSYADSLKNTRLKYFLKQSAGAIEFKLRSLPKGMSKEEWEGYEKQFWTNAMLMGQSRSFSVRFMGAAEEVSRHGRLPLVYLKRFDDKDDKALFGIQAIATYVIGIQKESDAIPLLIEKVKKDPAGSFVAGAACYALANIGGTEGINALRELAESREVKDKLHIARALASIGSREAAEILLNMSQTEKDKQLSDYYRGEAEYILRRLQKKAR